MPQASYGVTLAAGGVSIQSTIVRNGDHPNGYEVTLPPGTAGTLTTRTDTDTGVATLASGHGLITGNKVDVYWDGGMRYGMSATVAGDAVTIDAGAGDDLPAQDTAVVVTKQVTINTTIDGDNIQIAGIMVASSNSASTAKAHVDMQDSGPATIEAIDLTANAPFIYDIVGGAVNVFAGNVIVATKASNGSSSETLTLKIVSLEDSTP